MTKEEKHNQIKTLTKDLSEAPNFYLADIAGLDSKSTLDLRRACFKSNIRISVVKNTLLKKAMEDSKVNDYFEPLYKDKKNIKIIQETMFSSTNELRGTSYKSRIEDPKYQFAGKTGTAQVKRISKRERELDLKTSQIPYEERDHALYVAFGPYRNPRYAVSIIVEHGGSGSLAAAPMATKLFKLIVDQHQYRKQLPDYKEFSI